MTTTPKDIHTAMVQLRTGKITADEFRAISRKAKVGSQNWDKTKAQAVGLDQRSPYSA